MQKTLSPRTVRRRSHLFHDLEGGRAAHAHNRRLDVDMDAGFAMLVFPVIAVSSHQSHRQHSHQAKQSPLHSIQRPSGYCTANFGTP